MAFIHSFLSLSRETPRMVKFLFLKWLKVLTTLGFSILHGLHQLAQKSTSKYFPRKEEIFLISPFVSGNARSGAGLPTQRFSFVSYAFCLFCISACWACWIS